jgi:hypothetical protein
MSHHYSGPDYGFLGGYTTDEATRAAQTLSPDILSYDPSRPASYPGNGRTLTDDAIDVFLSILTNGKVTTDNVGPHKDLLTSFPYLGQPHKARSAATPVSGESPRAKLPGVAGSSNAPPGEDASEATVPVGAGVHGCASTSSRNAKRAVIARVGCSTISMPRQRSSSSIHSGIRICIPQGSATCTWCSPKEAMPRRLSEGCTVFGACMFSTDYLVICGRASARSM